MPVFIPSLPLEFDDIIYFKLILNIAIDIKPKNIIPIQWRNIIPLSLSLNGSTLNPMINSINNSPIAIPVINGILLRLPNKPLCVKEVMAFGPGITNAIAIIINNSRIDDVTLTIKGVYLGN